MTNFELIKNFNEKEMACFLGYVDGNLEGNAKANLEWLNAEHEDINKTMSMLDDDIKRLLND